MDAGDGIAWRPKNSFPPVIPGARRRRIILCPTLTGFGHPTLHLHQKELYGVVLLAYAPNPGDESILPQWSLIHRLGYKVIRGG